MKLRKFFKECRDHDVLKNLSIYIVSSWVLLQVIGLIAEPLGFSIKLVAYFLIVLLIAFPLYIYGIWKFQLAFIIKKVPVLNESGQPIPGKFKKSEFQKLYFSFLFIIGLICTSVSLFLVNRNIVSPGFTLDLEEGNRIAVLRFENLTGEPSKDILGEQAVDWIIHGITRNKLAQVISPQIIQDYSEVLRASIIQPGENVVMTDYLKPSRIIEGEFYENGDQLIFQCSITDGKMDRTYIAFDPVSCNSSTPLDCIEALSQRILGYLKTEPNRELNLQQSPPTLNAYKLFHQALGWRYKDTPYYLQLLDSAIVDDPDYFEPRLYQFMHYFNQENYAIADSLLQQLKFGQGIDPRQRAILNMYDALLKGDHRNSYKYHKEEYDITPFHLETNATMMVFTLQLRNMPMGVDSIFSVIDMKGMDPDKCEFCVERYKIKALSDIQLGRYDEALALLEGFAGGTGHLPLKKVLLRTLIRSGQYEAAGNLVKETQIVLNPDLRTDLQLYTAKELLREGRQDIADQYLDEAIKELENNNGSLSSRLGECLFYQQEYQRAEPYLLSGYLADTTNYRNGALLAITYQRNGKPDLADELVLDMQKNKGNYQFGELYYSLAQYHAGLGDEQKCLQNLLKSISEGHWYESGTFQNDPLLRKYYDTEGFRKVMTYWR